MSIITLDKVGLLINNQHILQNIMVCVTSRFWTNLHCKIQQVYKRLEVILFWMFLSISRFVICVFTFVVSISMHRLQNNLIILQRQMFRTEISSFNLAWNGIFLVKKKYILYRKTISWWGRFFCLKSFV